MADENEIKTNITGDATQFNSAMSQAQAKANDFFAAMDKGQKAASQSTWSQSIKEDTEKNLAGSARYMRDWANAILENSSRVAKGSGWAEIKQRLIETARTA